MHHRMMSLGLYSPDGGAKFQEAAGRLRMDPVPTELPIPPGPALKACEYKKNQNEGYCGDLQCF